MQSTELLRLAVISVSILAFSAPQATATPWYTQDPRTLPQGKWRVEEHVISSKTEDSVIAGDKVPLTAGAEATSTTYHTRVRYGVTDDLTVFADLPYVDRELVLRDGRVLESDGLGDITLLAKYKYHDDRARDTRRALALFYKPHNGDYVGMPPLVADGTGTTNVGLMHLWEFGAGKTTWYSSIGYVHTGEREDAGVDPGEVFKVNVAAEHQLADKSPWRFVWELNGTYQEHNERLGAKVPGTGGTSVYFTPGIQHVKKSQGRLVQLEAGVQLPLWYDDNVPALHGYEVYAGGFIVF